ncbi:hypothetical protein IMSAGC008_01810 [Muribaculaceae bacterium]|nr:hypothetical protein IMSAGC008_01810 [Muribaculaceae bacterium]
MVVGKVGFFVYGSKLELIGGNFVVACLNRYAQPVATNLKIKHERLHARRYRPEIVVFELLVLRAFVAHKGTTCHHKVGTGAIQAFVNKEVLLLPPKIGQHVLHLRVEIARHRSGGLVDAVQRAQERSLVVEALARIGYKYGRNTERLLHNESWR